MLVGWLLVLPPVAVAADQEAGREIYMKRCFWCHGEQGQGDGPSAVGMFPRPRDLVRADYRIRSTPHGQLPTDDDLDRVISRGLPGTPMPGWEGILTEDERRVLVTYVKSLSPRFASEKPDALTVPGGAGSAERGKEIYKKARCFMCHGDGGRGDGELTTTLNFEWGAPHTARDLTRGWTFKGGHEPGDIYLRITGGLNGTPMGPYQDLLSDQERWDLAHYIASLDQEPTEASEDFVVVAAHVDGEIPDTHEAPAWGNPPQILVPLAGQVVLDPPLRWWIPTAGSATVRAIWNGREVGFLLEWNDPTGPTNRFPDSALLQFAARDASKPYFLLGDADNPVHVWHWQTSTSAEAWEATGSDNIRIDSGDFRVTSAWQEGRWHVIFRGPIDGAMRFETGKFVPVLFSVRDGANAEYGDLRAISTWLYLALERPRSVRPWLSALAYLLGAGILELWVLRRARS